MEFGLREIAALASSGAIGALLVWGVSQMDTVVALEQLFI
jgi:hypothetical protein